jgi:acyl-CoA thioesterase-1
MSRIFLFLLAGIMAAPSYAETILVLGDSLSAAFGMAPERGWVHLLRTQLNSTEGQHRVINASISGETTAGGAARLGRLLERHRPTAVIIELGGNDGLRGMALRDSRVQLEFMINLALTQNADVLLLGMRLPPNYGPTYTAQFEAMYSTLAEAYAIRHIPFFLDGVAQTPSLMQIDRIHPTADAQPLLLNKVWPSINALLQEQTR